MTARSLSHLRATPLREFLYGTCYYPEHWDETLREQDPVWMQDAGFNCVRMGDFAWDLLEPEEGQFDFSVHTLAIERLGERGIKTIFCTPTAAPPVWLTLKHPEVLRCDAHGIPLQHGSRQHASHLSPVFREYSCKITAALARHFADNPHVIGWQTDNEMHCHFAEDHSVAAIHAFRAFLREKFDGDIDALNRAWGNAFWALTYRDFSEIPTPKADRPTHPNPAQVLDYHRFLSHGAARFQRDQVEILRAVNPKWFVTHNGCFASIDYRGEFTQDLDFLSYDVYPFFHHDARTRGRSQAYSLDLTRAYSGNFMVMEQQSGPGGQSGYFHDTPEPGEMRRMAYSSIARGADSLLFFRERSCRFGAEEYWCGLIDHDNVPRRRLEEARQLGHELKTVGPEILGTSVAVDIGIAAADFDSYYGHGPLSLGLPSPRTEAGKWHNHYFETGRAVGFVHPADDLSKLAVYVIPHFAQLDPGWLPNLTEFVENGGTLIIGARTASKTKDNNVVAETLPGVLRSLVGATVEEYGRQNSPASRPLELQIGDVSLTSILWYEQLRPDPGTQTLATWTSRHLAGSAAITLKAHGNGHVIYCGTYFDMALIEALQQPLAKLEVLPEPMPGFQPGVEIVRRTDGQRNIWFYLNHGDEPLSLSGTVVGTDLISGKSSEGTLGLPSHGVAVVRAR